MSFEFLSPAAALAGDRFTPVARSPMERMGRAAGAQFEVRDGWNVAIAYGSPEQDAEAARRTVGWADVSHLGKLELQGDSVEGALGHASRVEDGWFCPLTRSRALVVCEQPRLEAMRERFAGQASVVEVTTAFAALTLAGPLARETIARFCAIDLRPSAAPVGSLRPGSIARQPGLIVCEDTDRFLLLFGWALGQYMWTVVQDAGAHLGGRPIGVDALAPVRERRAEVPAGA